MYMNSVTWYPYEVLSYLSNANIIFPCKKIKTFHSYYKGVNWIQHNDPPVLIVFMTFLWNTHFEELAIFLF